MEIQVPKKGYFFWKFQFFIIANAILFDFWYLFSSYSFKLFELQKKKKKNWIVGFILFWNFLKFFFVKLQQLIVKDVV